MTNVDYQLILHALDAARTKFGLEVAGLDGAAERIRLLINSTVKAGVSEGFGIAIAASMLAQRLLQQEVGASDKEPASSPGSPLQAPD